jgi:hypothetical protein
LGRDFPLKLSFGNIWRERTVKNLDNYSRQKQIDIENKLDENKKSYQQIENNHREIENIKIENKDNIGKACEDAIVFQLKLKKFQRVVNELKENNDLFYNVTLNFDTFTDSLRKGHVQSIIIPSRFLSKSIDKMRDSVEYLGKALLEIEQVRIKVESREDKGFDFDFLVKLIEAVFQFFKSVSTLVFSFNERLKEFKRKLTEHFSKVGYGSISEKISLLEADTEILDPIIYNLQIMANKIEAEKMQKMNDLALKAASRRPKVQEELIFSFKS